ncbi:zinc finger BED domain-containing protein RICESLEEPER 3-like [Bidens hawaiensis]|uniref:zinc finger BED domain-containing protein RICESLEEPER 3-like n=1 Tax=Bidens hawaiensis TaxID=980011 RepID=UPI004049769C
MHAIISEMSLESDEIKKKMANSMKTKFDKYWENLANMNLLLYVALVLDPRNKMFNLSYCLGLIHGEDSEKVKEIVKLVEKSLVELYNNYKMKMDKPIERKNTSSSSTVDGEKVIDLEDGYLKYLEKKCGTEVNTSEVEIYLRDGTEKKIKGDDAYDVLGWWKLNTKKFLILSKLARHVLGMPISTVASESAFSTGGRVIDQYRSSLTPKTAESLICVQDSVRSISTDLQGSQLYGVQLEDVVDNLEKIEEDMSHENKISKDSFIEDEDWD